MTSFSCILSCRKFNFSFAHFAFAEFVICLYYFNGKGNEEIIKSSSSEECPLARRIMKINRRNIFGYYPKMCNEKRWNFTKYIPEVCFSLWNSYTRLKGNSRPISIPLSSAAKWIINFLQPPQTVKDEGAQVWIPTPEVPPGDMAKMIMVINRRCESQENAHENSKDKGLSQLKTLWV